ncbi:unnamed protein product, partial [Mesorhabditis belari]|uniref:RING-type domain-containing protein n=1 Tax=Mesorhabditis belari TaxID=2138241 RepID=A0AAF3EUA0_9BILA
MRVFESLNCILCKEPFSRVANQPRSPRKLGCGLAMCHECFEMEKAQKKEDRKHHCNNGNCFYNPNFAYFLIDMLAEEDALTLAPMERGYVLAKPFKVLECSVCRDDYSTKITERQPFAMYCNHTICTGCFLKLRVQNENGANKEMKYMITCPTCGAGSETSRDKWKDRLHDFLDELPRMTRQLQAAMNAPTCDECYEKYIIDVMFYCSMCRIKICGSCAYLQHRLHDAKSLLTKQAGEMLVELRNDSANVVKNYEDLLPELHKGILEDVSFFKTKLLLKENILTDVSTFGDLMEKHQTFTKVKTDFEATTERYLPGLRKFETEVKALIDALDKNPDPNVTINPNVIDGPSTH